jgi:hypothetical protein
VKGRKGPRTEEKSERRQTMKRWVGLLICLILGVVAMAPRLLPQTHRRSWSVAYMLLKEIYFDMSPRRATGWL